LLNPYDITTANSGRDYTFTTKREITYSVYFIDKSSSFGEINRVFEFGFFPIGEHSCIPLDSRVGHTIALIFQDFFLKSDNVILYIPYAEDNKDKKRLLRFNRWFKSFNGKLKCPMLHMDTIKIVSEIDDIDLDVAAIYKPEQKELSQKVFSVIEKNWRDDKLVE
jgi:hypothetical protein